VTDTWVDVADGSPFTLEGLPYGVFARSDGAASVGVPIGDFVLDLAMIGAADLLPADVVAAASLPSVGGLLALDRKRWRSLRASLQELLTTTDGRAVDRARAALVDRRDVRMLLPFVVRDYVDFYSSIEHATNLGRLMRPGQEPLLPNWRHLPVGYHGRASTVVVSGTPIRRPRGQLRPSPDEPPFLGATRMLDFELEVGFVTGGRPTELGAPIAVDEAEEHIYGLVLVNDWSARDIQAWEYQPLGPFLSKSFATSISPWVVPLEALDAFRVPAPAQEPVPLDYLRESRRRGIDMRLRVDINGTTVSATNFADMYWTMAQQLAHMTVNGSVVTPGDLYASGTVSGSEQGTQGSLIELTKRAAEPITLDDGSTRGFLDDGDVVTITGWCGEGSTRVGFGEVVGEVLPAR
jgi:fumarylacetoacetase